MWDKENQPDPKVIWVGIECLQWFLAIASIIRRRKYGRMSRKKEMKSIEEKVDKRLEGLMVCLFV